MSTARKYTFNDALNAHEWRKKAYAAINIIWLQMRPDLKFEDKGTIREERLAWIASLLNLKKLGSTTLLSDGQIGLVLDEMREMTGTKPAPVAAAPSSGNVVSIAQFKRQHYASGEQKYTLDKIIKHIGWTNEQTENFLKKRKFAPEFEKLSFKTANALTMILLNIAADKDLRRILGKGEKISRKMTADYIPTLKKKLEIDR